jgi:hypothetical protein
MNVLVSRSMNMLRVPHVSRTYNAANQLVNMQDAPGSVRGYANENNVVLSSINYSEYGVPDAAITSFAFNGEWRDENALQYHRTRYYAPGIGRPPVVKSR